MSIDLPYTFSFQIKTFTKATELLWIELCSPQIPVFLLSQNLPLFGGMIFTEVIKLKQGH